MRCQVPDEPKRKTFQGYLWAISRRGNDAVLDWRLTRQHGETTGLLYGFKGVLQSDGYDGYARYAANHPQVIRVACFAHTRRKLNDALDTAPAAAGFMLQLIGHLYRMDVSVRPKSSERELEGEWSDVAMVTIATLRGDQSDCDVRAPAASARE